MNEILEKLLKECITEMQRAHEQMLKRAMSDNMFDFYSGYKNAMKTMVDEIVRAQAQLTIDKEKGDE